MPVAVSTWDETKSEAVLPGVSRQVIDGQNQTVVRYLYQPGAVFPVHELPEEQMTFVLSGTIAFSIVGQTSILRPGSIAVIPGNTPHGAEVIGAEAVETLNTISPRRASALSFPATGEGPS